jgi:hypothetical protein
MIGAGAWQGGVVMRMAKAGCVARYDSERPILYYEHHARALEFGVGRKRRD